MATSNAVKWFRGLENKRESMQLSFFLLNSSFSSKSNLGPDSASKFYSRLVTLRCRNNIERLTSPISCDSQLFTIFIILTSPRYDYVVHIFILIIKNQN